MAFDGQSWWCGTFDYTAVGGYGNSWDQRLEKNFTLPAVAVFADEAGKSQVWVVDPKDNTVHRRAVETGDLTGTDGIRVESGLKTGETVAVSAVSRLREGMEVRPVDKVEF